MNTCTVIRCSNPVDTVHVWDSTIGRIELGVCASHAASLDAGAERAYQRDRPEQTAIIMGDDLAGTGDHFVTGFHLERGVTVTSPDGTPALRVVLDTKRRGSEQPGQVEFMVSQGTARKLAEAILRPL